MSAYEKTWDERLQAMNYAGGGILHQYKKDSDGVKFALTPEEMSYLLDVLNQYRSLVAQRTTAFASESEESSLNDMVASFAYQRAL